MTSLDSGDCGQGLWEPALLHKFQTSYLDFDSGSSAIFQLLESWIDRCEKQDSSCVLTEHASLPRRVIRVGRESGHENPALFDGTGILDRYTTLSYRWGNSSVNTHVTTESNLESRKLRFPLTSMPKTIRDAITVTRRLGVLYLWVDAICIVQDSVQDWEEQSAHMYEIYANAWLNISADGARNSHEGFLRRRNPLSIRPCIFPNLIAGVHPGVKISPRFPLHRGPRAISCGIPEDQPSYLTSRGWVLQENLLSGRIVHWNRNEVTWECKGFDASERKPQGELFNVHDGMEKVIRAVLHEDQGDAWTVQQYISSSIDRRTPKTAKPFRETISLEMTRRWCKAWHRVVERFSDCILTKEEDTLFAILGLAYAFKAQAHNGSTYLAGLWRQDFPYCLCWYRRETRPNTPSQTAGHRLDIAPSFSWASVGVSIRYFSLGSYVAQSLVELLDGEDGFRSVTERPQRQLRPRITLRGPVVPYHDLVSLPKSLRTKNWLSTLYEQIHASTSYRAPQRRYDPLHIDFPELYPNGEAARREMLCICMFIVPDDRREVPKFVCCLLVMPAMDYSSTGSETLYQRVGVYLWFDCGVDVNQLGERTLTLV